MEMAGSRVQKVQNQKKIKILKFTGFWEKGRLLKLKN